MRGYARMFGEDESEWGIVGLIHDFDYERWPDPDNHPFRGCEILRERGYPEHMIRAILLPCRLQWRRAREPARAHALRL